MRVLVTGGRDYKGERELFRVLDAVHEETPIKLLIEGWCERGADRLARFWCWQRKVPCLSDPPNWAEYGKAAGPIRNAKMLTDWQPDLVIAFPGGAGTADMVSKAERAGVKVVRA